MPDATLDIRVRYDEVDQMGIVYHPAYLSWFEMGRIALLDGIGLPYGELEAAGVQLPLVRVEARYRRPLRFDQWFRLETRVETLTRVRVGFSYRLRVGEALHAEGATEHAAVAAATGRPRRLEAAVMERFLRLPSQGGAQPVPARRDPSDARLLVG